MITLDSKIEIFFRDKKLIPIWEKIRSNKELNLSDGITLFESNDLISIGKMANWLCSIKNSDVVYFVVNQKIEPTNICVLSCKFCDFAVKKNDKEAYELTIQEILEKLHPELTEVHITGGLHPDWEWDYYVNLIKEIKKKYPAIDVKAYTAVEIDFFHKKFKKSIEDILLELKEAGLKTLPGGGAEVFSERVRRLLFNQKIGEKRWMEIHKTAHKLGIKSNATLLYGHIETIEERINHLIKLREAQKETNGFLSFIPLAFQPGTTGIKPQNQFTSAIDDLKTIAISRLFLNNFNHIKAYWVMLTEQLASVALNFGANDLDGTVGGEKIAHDAGAISPMELAKEKLIKIINDSGKIPSERDIYYNPTKLHSNKIIGRIPYLNNIPFFQFMEKEKNKIFSAFPSKLGEMLDKKFFDISIVSLIDFFKNENNYEMLPFGIVAKEKSLSVLLKSKFKIEELNNKTIAINKETSTSIKLLELLLSKKYNLNFSFVREDIAKVAKEKIFDAYLIIGDNALIDDNNQFYPYIYDIASLWYEWQNLPFVFAVWCVKKDLPIEEKNKYENLIKNSIENAKSNRHILGLNTGNKLGLSEEKTREYLSTLYYELTEEEYKSITLFKNFLGYENR